MLKGAPASSGIGIGRAVILSRRTFRATRRPILDPAAELRRFSRAADIFCTRMTELAETAAVSYGESEAGILTAQIMIVNDPDLQKEISVRVREQGENIEYAVAKVLDGYIRHFSSLDNEILKARADDFCDIKNHLLGILSGRDWAQLPELPPDCVLVAEDLSPSRAAMLPVRQISAIVDAGSTSYSHIAIMARAARIPTVVSASGELFRAVRNGDELIVDGGAGEIIHLPTAEEVQRYRQRQQHHNLIQRRMESYRRQKTLTRDSRQLELSACLNELGELPGMVEYGVDGLLLSHEKFFGEEADEQRLFLSYRGAVRALKGLPVTVCVGDAHMRRHFPPVPGIADDRLYTILTALLRVSVFGKVRVMVSGVTTPAGIRQVREILERCKSSLLRRYLDFDPGVSLGIAVETPASALCVHALAQEADFLMLCADCLARCTLAADSIPGAAELPGSFHPAVLQLLCQVIQTAGMAGIPAYVCGRTAADPMMLPFLIGCGASGLNVPVSAVAGIRDQVANLSQSFWHGRIPDILALDCPEDVGAYLKKNWSERGDW